MARRLLAHALLAVGLSLSVATSYARVEEPPREHVQQVSATVSSEAIDLGEVALDYDTPALFTVTVRSHGEFTLDGAGVGGGTVGLGVELEGDWPDYGAVVLWELDSAEDACTIGAGESFRSGVAYDGLARVEAEVRADRPLLVAARLPGASMYFRGALRVYAIASITVDGATPLDASAVTPMVDAALVPFDCADTAAPDTSDTGPADTAASDTGPVDTAASDTGPEDSGAP